MFSELVDTAVSRSGRPDKRADVIAFINQTVREMVAKHYFAKNLVEDTVVASADPFIFQRPIRLQRFRTVQYANGTFPPFIQPGRKMADFDEYYYAAASYFVFKGAVFAGSLSGSGNVNVAYYQFPKHLSYYGLGLRPATYDFDLEVWTYLPAFDVDEDTREQARDLVSNWLLRDWYDLVTEGTLAKIFKVVDDSNRASTHFSFFERAYAAQFLATEIYESFDK